MQQKINCPHVHLPVVAFVAVSVLTVEIGVYAFSEVELNISDAVEDVFCVIIAGDVLLFIMFIKPTVVGSLIDTDVAIVDWDCLTVTVSVDLSVNKFQMETL